MKNLFSWLKRRNPGGILAIVVLLGLIAAGLNAQLQQSGGPGSSVTILAGTNLIGKVGIDQTTPGTTNAVALAQLAGNAVNTGTGAASTGTLRVAVSTDSTFSIANSAFGLNAGVANVGIIRSVPSSCTQSTNFASATSQVATGAGSSITGNTTCVTFAYANNITNSAVTLRLADKAGTPVIWLGGNADFAIPANSNIRIPLDGVTFTSGITAIAGTASAINLQVNGLQ